MVKHHLQVRFVKDEQSQTEEPPFQFPIDEVNQLVTRIFIGIGALIALNTLGKIVIYKVS